MTPRQECLAIIAEHGAELFDIGTRAQLLGSVWTPPGLVWYATGCHVISLGYHTDRSDGWVELLADLRKGTDRCDQPDCDTCTPVVQP